MKIAIIVEGKTEKAFVHHLRQYLERHLAGRMPNLDTLPYDGRIPKEDKLRRVVVNLLAGHNRTAPAGNPETVDHGNPPANRIREMFEAGQSKRSYVKARDAGRILRDNDLSVAIDSCTELKALVNTILSVCGETSIP